MAEQTAEPGSSTSSELDELESLISETSAEDASPPQSAAALDEVIAAEAEAPAPTAAGDAEASSVAAPNADHEIEEFLAAAAAGQARETSGDAEAEPAEAAPEAAPASDETPDADAPAAEPRTPLVRRLLSLIGRMLETILVWIDAPVAKLREDIKALLGYLAVATAVMAGVTWLIVFLR